MPKLKINPDLIIENIDNKITIFDPEKSILYTLNEMSTLIFKLIQRKESEQKILQNVLTSYDVSEQKAQKDISSFITNLTKNNIIHLAQ